MIQVLGLLRCHREEWNDVAISYYMGLLHYIRNDNCSLMYSLRSFAITISVNFFYKEVKVVQDRGQ